MVVDDPSPGVGSNVTFTLTLSNAGPNDAQALGVKDVLPSNMSFVSASPTDYDAGTGIWGIFRVATGESASIDIVATVNDTSTVTNYAELYISSYIDADSIRGNNSTNEDDDASVAVTGQAVSADLSLHAGGSPSLDARIGGPSGVQVTVTNNGPDTANDVVVRDNLASLSEFAFDFADTAESGADYDFATGTWDVGTLESGASETLEVHLTVTAAGEPTYRVEIVHSSAADPDSTPGNLEATGGSEDDGSLFGFLARGNSTDLSLDMSADDASSAVGANVTFTLTVRNHGPYTVLGVSVKDLLPAGLSFVSATPPPNTEYDSTTGVWTTGNLGSGDSAALLIVATVTSAPVTNYAEIVTADLDDPDFDAGQQQHDRGRQRFGHCHRGVARPTTTSPTPRSCGCRQQHHRQRVRRDPRERRDGHLPDLRRQRLVRLDARPRRAGGLRVRAHRPLPRATGGQLARWPHPGHTQPFGIGFSTFRAIAGTTYHIVVEGSPGSSSAFSITFGLIASPANDDFADAEVLAGDTADITGTVVAASREIDEPTSCPSFAGSVWYAWTPDHDGLAGTESLPPAFCLEVYEGTALGTLARVPNLSSQGGTLFRAVAGTTYHIAVAGSPVAGSSPSFTIHRSFQALPGQ